MKIQIRTFGECYIDIGPRRIFPDAEIVFALLLYLAWAQGRRVDRDLLRELLWPTLRHGSALQNLRQAVYKLGSLYGIPLDTSATGIALPPSAVEADFVPFAHRGAPLTEIPDATLLGGDFLGGYSPTFSPAYAEWSDTLRTSVEHRVRTALRERIEARRSIGAWPQVEALARRLTEIDPLNEQAVVRLAESLAFRGAREEAVSVLDDYLIHHAEQNSARRSRSADALRSRILGRVADTAYPYVDDQPFVGRSDSLHMLNDFIALTHRGGNRGVYIWGPPGIGKSRLISEFARASELAGKTVARVACEPADATRPLSVFADLSPVLLGLPGGLGCEGESLRHLRLLGTHTKATSARSSRAPSEELAANVRRALLDVLDSIAGEVHLIVVIEDVHWADPDSVNLLVDLFAWCGTRQLQFLLTSRSPAHLGPDAIRFVSAHAMVHRLGPLSDNDSLLLLSSLAEPQGRHLPQEFVDWAITVGDGNPLFLKELFTRWLTTGEVGHVPPSLSTLLHSRVSSLAPRELRLLQACAVLRRQSRADRLQALLGYSNYDLLEALEVLGSLDLIAVNNERIEAKHELLSDAAQSLLSDAARQAMCRIGAELLQAEVGAGAAVSLLWDCVRLWRNAGDGSRTARAAMAFARQLMDVGQPAEAARLLNDATHLASETPILVPLFAALIEAQAAAGQWAALISSIPRQQVLRNLMPNASSSHDATELLLLEAKWRVLGDPGETLSAAKACLEASDAARDHIVGAATIGLSVADAMCDTVSAQDIFSAGLRAAGKAADTRSARLTMQLMFHTTFGDLDEGVAAARDLTALSAKRASPTAYARALRFAATTFRRAGMHEQALGSLLESADLAKRYEMRSAHIAALIGLCYAFVDANDMESLHSCLETLQDANDLTDDRPAHLDLLGLRLIAHVAKQERPGKSESVIGVVDKVDTEPLLRRRVYGAALRVLAKLSADQLPAITELTGLIALHRATRAYGGQDIATCILVYAMNARNMHDEAVSLWHEYIVHFRRERGNCRIGFLAPPRSDAAVIRCAQCPRLP